MWIEWLVVQNIYIFMTSGIYLLCLHYSRNYQFYFHLKRMIGIGAVKIKYIFFLPQIFDGILLMPVIFAVPIIFLQCIK